MPHKFLGDSWQIYQSNLLCASQHSFVFVWVFSTVRNVCLTLKCFVVCSKSVKKRTANIYCILFYSTLVHQHTRLYMIIL